MRSTGDDREDNGKGGQGIARVVVVRGISNSGWSRKVEPPRK